MFVHIVFFWLDPATPEPARRQLLDDCPQFLRPIPGVRELWAGPPAQTPRPVVDNSYDVGLCVVLADKAAHDVYQAHDLHRQFIERNRQHWKRIQVYDFVQPSAPDTP
jgi:hypothetical protein